MPERFVAALDGGGSKTAAAIAFEDGRVIRPGNRGGCNPQDNPDWAEALEAAMGPLQGAAHAILGLPGFGEVPSIDKALTRTARGMLGDRVTVMNDVTLAARAAFPQGGGVLVLSGTGSMAVATGPSGTFRAGGWGDLFSDEGSGYWIGREALARASRERDGRSEDRGLATAIEARLGISGDGQFALLGWALTQRHPRSAIASVSRIVDTLAETGLAPARDILNEAARELAHLARSAAGLAGLWGPRPWAPGGSVFHSRLMRDEVSRLLDAAPVTPAASTLAGGLILAAEAAGWSVDDAWCEKVSRAAA